MVKNFMKHPLFKYLIAPIIVLLSVYYLTQKNKDIPQNITYYNQQGARNKASTTDIIESIVIESRLTSVLKENTKYPPAVFHFEPISGAPAVFEGPAGTIKLIFQSPINFKRLDKDEIIIINKFNMLSGSDLSGRSVSVLHNYESLIVPIVTAMFGNSFSTLRLLEITIYLNRDVKWYKSWVYNIDFPRGNSFNIPLSEILVD